jgi:hypothetical protein
MPAYNLKLGHDFFLPHPFKLIIHWSPHHSALFRQPEHFSSLWLYSPSDLGHFFSFLILYTIGRTPWTGKHPIARPTPTHRTTQTQNKRKQTSMPRVGIELTTPVFEGAKTVHASDRAVTVIGSLSIVKYKIRYSWFIVIMWPVTSILMHIT